MRSHTIRCLRVWSSQDEQLRYKEQVPFVHIPEELLTQWESFCHVRDRQGQYFKPVWSKEEWDVLQEFDQLVKETIPTMGRYLPDVPTIFTHPKWMLLMQQAQIAMHNINETFNQE